MHVYRTPRPSVEAFGAMLHAMGALETQHVMVQCRDRTGSQWIFGTLGANQRKVGLDQGIIIGVRAVLSFIALQH
jgi:hypothetical protein